MAENPFQIRKQIYLGPGKCLVHWAPSWSHIWNFGPLSKQIFLSIHTHVAVNTEPVALVQEQLKEAVKD